MKLKLLILTTSKNLWPKKDFADITKTIERANGVTVEAIDIKYITPPLSVETVPKDEGRIMTLGWFKNNLPIDPSYNAICFHCSTAEAKRWGLVKYTGLYWFDDDDVLDFYVVADEGQKAQNYPHSEFWRIIVHEIAHGALKYDGQYDALNTVHQFDYILKNIDGLYSLIDFTYWNSLQLQKQTLTNKLKSLMFSLFGAPAKLFDKDYPISQSFGVSNPIYPQTGHHIGTDFATPMGTKLYAPYSGIMQSGWSDAVGNYIILNTKNGSFRFLHLLNQAKRYGEVSKGELIGWTGATGTQSPHCHAEWWYHGVDVSVLTAENFRSHLEDITTLYA